MTHYEVLGVEVDATDTEIKNAYRAKAKECHPDKSNGSDKDFIPLAKAYEILSDSKKRLLYDKTGQDNHSNFDSIEKEVQNCLLQIFNEAIKQEPEVELLIYVTNWIEQREKQAIQDKEHIKNRIKKLKVKRKKISSKGQVNYAHLVIDGEIKNFEGGLLITEHALKVFKAIKKELKSYSEEKEPPKEQAVFVSFQQFNSATTGNW